MNERSNEQSGSSSASGSRQPEYGQYAQGSAAGTGGEQHPDESRYGQYTTGEQGYSGQNGQDYANGGYTGGHGAQGYDSQNYDSQNYGGQGYGSQPGYDQQAGGYPTHYQNGYQQQPYGGQDYGSQGYGGYNNHPGQVQGPVPGKGLAIASLVLGIVGILTFWFGGLGGLLGLVGLVLGIIGLVKIRRSKRDSPALAIVGIVLSSLALIGGIFMAIVTFWALNTASDCVQYLEDGQQAQYQQCITEKVGGDSTPNT